MKDTWKQDISYLKLVCQMPPLEYKAIRVANLLVYKFSSSIIFVLVGAHSIVLSM